MSNVAGIIVLWLLVTYLWNRNAWEERTITNFALDLAILFVPCALAWFIIEGMIS